MFTISQIAKTINGKINGNPNLYIKGVADIKNSSSECLSYITSKKYEKLFHNSKAIAMIVDYKFNVEKGDKTLIHVKNPAKSFIDVINLFHPQTISVEKIHSSVIMSNNVEVGKKVTISAFTLIEENVTIGRNKIWF